MTLADHEWRNLPVETALGTAVGRLTAIELDPDTHRVAYYHVRRRRLVSSGPDLLVSPAQVVSLTKEKMVVDDLVVRDRAVAEGRKPNLAPTAPAMPASQ
jgi:hypothetical protein